MRSMTLLLRHSTGSESFDNVTSFVGEDASGAFGILPGHSRMMTALGVGLARFRIGESEWHYLALPGGIIEGGGDRLTLCTRRYLHDTELRRMGTLLAELQLADQEAVGGIRESLHRLEEEMLRRLREIERGSQ
ncbi:MAG: hypothetical protein PHY09_02820 [Desulfuromonadaceae bacterium]|nr:hypothetical protein [Desulfuromonadaceae bacterium]MDD5104426.1 hypothetical protein [Desulfuromonadaceae bacterium]